MSQTRRLAAILAADVAGYSRLMGADEEGTHERLQGHLREVVDPKIKDHHGRIVKNTGDGLLAEFASVVDAGRCATEIQRSMGDREPGSELLRLRPHVPVSLVDIALEAVEDLRGGSQRTRRWRKADSNLRSLPVNELVSQAGTRTRARR